MSRPREGTERTHPCIHLRPTYVLVAYAGRSNEDIDDLHRLLTGEQVGVPSQLIDRQFSSNVHDRSVEAAMSSIFVIGPIGAVAACIVGVVRVAVLPIARGLQATVGKDDLDALVSTLPARLMERASEGIGGFLKVRA